MIAGRTIKVPGPGEVANGKIVCYLLGRYALAFSGCIAFVRVKNFGVSRLGSMARDVSDSAGRMVDRIATARKAHGGICVLQFE